MRLIDESSEWGIVSAIFTDKRPEVVVFIREGYVTFDDGHTYEIDLDRIIDPLDVCKWVAHLSEKTWMTTDAINEFVVKTCLHKGWSPYGN